jgi:DNA-binding GntR family transcriptional regulator
MNDTIDVKTPAGSRGSGDAEDGSTLSTHALAKIMGLIRAGELRPGSVVNEADLAKRFGVSRGPIREAMRQLEGRKLLIREPYQRARVVDLDLRRIREIYELREALEGMACRLAAARMSEEALAAMMQAVEFAKGPENYSFIDTQYPFNFHEEVVKSCGNEYIQQALATDLYDLIRLYRWSNKVKAVNLDKPSRDHWQICRAMMARDQELSESLMRAHIQRALTLIETHST